MSEITAALPRRDVRIVGVVSLAHFSSHFFQLVLPPLFPVMKDALGVGYVQLGLVMTVFFAASGVAQVVAGFLVDRFGPQRVLPTGIALFGAATLIAGLTPNYWALIPVAVLAGLGNSVFHPADYAIMTARVTPTRLARAYSVHVISGTLGWAAAPMTMLALSDLLGWRMALVAAGLAGLALAAFVALEHTNLSVAHQRKAEASPGASSARFLLALPIVMCLVYFALLSMAQSGSQNFLPSLLPQVQGITYALAITATTVYLSASALGSLVGGFIADKTPNHEHIVGGGLLGGGVATLATGFAALSLPLLFVTVAAAGFLTGTTIPSRDMLVRAATPPGATGKVFGFVYSGLDLGAMLAPLVIGFTLDRGYPQLAFAFMAAALVATVASAFVVKGAARRAA
ncbi:MFS transporter [Chelatococcus sp. SYSU_G07232]|uniref:MFS transporter n=1 Tax=Chelatococcus albus TaxID=3047466 RepID=A0ABT7AIE6_9HYPH|nr:MFS transporter [Chelatococcus sp. SYSU_G07232]MDJ1158767.1 MFS transporter [Chelatococcus sp. SYSU_G07232]